VNRNFPESTPVLIVGGGPVGMAVAAELGRYGVECLLVEATDGTVDHPRASALNSRTMEFCRRWGISETVQEVGTPPDFPHSVIYVTSLTGYLMATVDRSHHGGGSEPLPETPERPQRCNQIWFNPVLRDHVETLPSVTQMPMCRLEAIEADGDGYIGTLRDLTDDITHRIAARFVVAACGGRSPVPGAIGVTMGPDSLLSHSINIFIRTPALWERHDKGKAALNFFVGTDGLWGGLTAQDGRDYWRLTLHGNKSYIDPATIDPHFWLRRAFGGEFEYEFLNMVAWARREWTAERFQQDGIFLVGDAAHQNSPSGGFGLNTGMGDAIDLGWKLASVINGWGGAGMLGSYEIERRPVALRNVTEAADNYRRYALPDTAQIDDPGPVGEVLRKEIGEGLGESQRRQMVTDGIALGYRYDPSPICIPDGTAMPPDDFGVYTPIARPGSRAPHGWIAPGKSIIDLFGDGFVLLRFGEDAPEPEKIVTAARACGVPLAVETIGDPALADLYQAKLVLVRPDGHVAWRGNSVPADPLSIIDRVRGAA
jgi:2-polyprenyl-6-methoxyphenol hydroxylase-like FAD-dependent oxidoreductase